MHVDVYRYLSKAGGHLIESIEYNIRQNLQVLTMIFQTFSRLLKAWSLVNSPDVSATTSVAIFRGVVVWVRVLVGLETAQKTFAPRAERR